MQAEPEARTTSAIIAAQIQAAGERLWRYEDFAGLPATAVNQTLSRLARKGILTRVRKGLYYRPRPTLLGPSRPAECDILARVLRHKVHPTGTTAANLLGLSTQNPARAEYATVAAASPQNLKGIRLTARRPKSREHLNDIEGAILETLRSRAAASEQGPEETKERLLSYLRRGDTFARLAQAALDEPPRVRAMLGALGQEMGADRAMLDRLRTSLNPLSRFDFGLLTRSPYARGWQAKVESEEGGS